MILPYHESETYLLRMCIALQFSCDDFIILLDSMRWFSHWRSPSPPGGTQWYRLLLRAAYGLATAHAVLYIVNGDDSPVCRFLSLVILTFDLDRQTLARLLYNLPSRQV